VAEGKIYNDSHGHLPSIHHDEPGFEVPSIWNRTRTAPMPLFLAQVHSPDHGISYNIVSSDIWSLYNNVFSTSYSLSHCPDASVGCTICLESSCSCTVETFHASSSHLLSSFNVTFAGIGGQFEEITVNYALLLLFDNGLD